MLRLFVPRMVMGLFNNALRPQVSQVRRGQAKRAEHLVGVLADGGRVMMDASGAFWRDGSREPAKWLGPRSGDRVQ